MLAPVVLFTYKRYDHTERVLHALNQNDLAEESELFIFCDGAKNEKDFADVERVHQVVKTFAEGSRFKKVHVRISETNNGLAPSVIRGVSEIINTFGTVIVLEDDLITTKDFLKYMNGALDFYRDNPKIWSISGYSFFSPDLFSNYPHDIYMGYRGCSWGWASWKDRWEMVDWNVSDYNQFKFNPILRRRFCVSGNDMPGMLDSQMKGFISSWAIRWCYCQNKLKMYTVFPVFSRIKNIGTDGSGTHSGNNNRFDTNLVEDVEISFQHLEVDKDILKQYRKKFDRPFLSLVKQFVKHVILSKK